MAQGRGLATPTRTPAGRTARRGQARLVQGGDRRFARTRTQRRPKTGPSPVDRAKTGSKHHVITEGAGIPLAVTLTGGNRHDVTQLLPLINAIPPVRGKRGRPRRRPDTLYADRAYDYDTYRDQVQAKGITPYFAQRGTEHGSGLGVHRWVVEQTVALLHWFRRLRIRWEIRDDIHEAFMSLACAIICYRRLTK
jgi:transposase